MFWDCRIVIQVLVDQLDLQHGCQQRLPPICRAGPLPSLQVKHDAARVNWKRASTLLVRDQTMCVVVTGIWGNWGSWGSCSATCRQSIGTTPSRYRYRTCASSCTGSSYMEQFCTFLSTCGKYISSSENNLANLANLAKPIFHDCSDMTGSVSCVWCWSSLLCDLDVVVTKMPTKSPTKLPTIVTNRPTPAVIRSGSAITLGNGVTIDYFGISSTYIHVTISCAGQNH